MVNIQCTLRLNIRLITLVIELFPGNGLTEVQEVADLLHVLSHYQVGVLKISLLLLGLLCQDVAMISVMTLYLTTAGEHESLLCTGVCLYFWHFLFFV